MLTDWGNYFFAMTGAAATLTGLIFVGASISLKQILATPKLSNRVLESLMLLTVIIIVASLCLVPKQTLPAIGTEVLGVGLLTWIVTLRMDIDMLRNTEQQYKKHYKRNILLTQLSILPYILAAIMILSCGETGLYFLVPAFIFSFCKSLLDAWVLLIEINR